LPYFTGSGTAGLALLEDTGAAAQRTTLLLTHLTGFSARSGSRATIDWRFTIPNARDKLKKLYPVREEQ